MRPTEPSYKGRTLSEWLDASFTVPSNSRAELNRQEAEEAIQQMGSDAVPFLVKWLCDDPTIASRRLSKIQNHLPPSLQRSWIMVRLERKISAREMRAELRAWSAETALIRLGPAARPALTQLMRVFRDPRQWSPGQTGYRAANVLSGLGKEALPQILQCFSDPQFTNGRIWILVDVIRRMSNLEGAGDRAVPILCDLLARNDPNLHQGCVEALGNLAAAPTLAVPALSATLTNALATPDIILSRKCAEALGKFGPNASNAVPVLCLALKSPDGITTEEAARTLGKIRAFGEVAVPALIQYLKESNAKHRKYAIEGLTGYGSAAAEATPLIRDALLDEDHDTRSVARQALEQLTLEP